ncbi:hypothetical protein KR044_000516 [Drosophila immigrans]|nr:hypothetical protein KR044_000516 [Drosophila immigrans]
MMNNLSSGCNTWRRLPRQGMIWWQSYRCNVMQSFQNIDKKLTTFAAGRLTWDSRPTVGAAVVQRNILAMVPQHRLGVWCKSLVLPTSFLWTKLQPQRDYFTKPKTDRFDKFGRKCDATSNDDGEEEEGEQMPYQSYRSAAKAKSTLTDRSTEKSRNVAKQRTARTHKLPIEMTPEGHLDEKEIRNHNKSKQTRSFYLKNNYLLMDRRKSGYYVREPPKKSMEHSAAKRQPKKQSISDRSMDKKHKSERDGLKHLLADLLNRKPKLLKSNANYEYVKTSPIFKVIKHSPEGRNTLRAGGFQKQLELPSIFKHPLAKHRMRKINAMRRMFPPQSASQLERKRTKSALKTKLCLLLQDHKDQDDDVD